MQKFSRSQEHGNSPFFAVLFIHIRFPEAKGNGVPMVNLTYGSFNYTSKIWSHWGMQFSNIFLSLFILLT